MIKSILWLGAALVSSAVAITQEELAQYVAQQQTASLGAQQPSLGGQQRRQAYLLQPKSLGQPAPRQQVYQFQPKAAVPQYQLSSGNSAESGQQYYSAAVQQEAAPAPQQYYQPQQQLRAQPGRKLLTPQQQLEEDENNEPPQPYQFGFDIKDDEFTNYQNRKEQREGDKISGSYSVVDSDGYIRTVTYTADPLGGFKAEVTREPTDIKIKIPQPQLQPDQYSGQNLAVRKQQTQQYLQAAVQPKQQYAIRPEHTQVIPGAQAQQLRQYQAIPQQYQQYQQ